MATVTLVPTGITDPSANIASGAATDIDNTIAGLDDGALVTTVTNDFVAGSVTFALSDVPANAVVSDARFRTRARFVNPGSGDTCDYICTLTGTSLPATTTAQWDETDAGAGFANRGAASQEACTPTEANINAWTVVLTQANYVKDMGPDGFYFDISEIEVIVTYTVGATINEVTSPGSDNYAASTDFDIELRQRYREQTDSNTVTDPAPIATKTTPSTINEVTVTEYFPVHGDALVFEGVFSTALRERNRDLTDSAAVQDALGSPIISTVLSDAIDVTDDAIELRERNREQANSAAVADNDVSFKEARRDQTDIATANDNNLQLRERTRGQSDSITADDVSVDIRLVDNELVETIDPNDDSVELRERNRLAADSIVVEDDKIATYVPEGAGIFNVTLQDLDSCALTDFSITLRERNREQADNAVTADNNLQLRERARSQSDSITADDVRSQWIENNEAQIETIDPADDSVELRERNRLSTDSISVGDDKTATYIGAEGAIYSRTLQDLDSCDVADNAIELRLRDRETLDDAVLLDDKIATYVPAGAVINNVTLQDLDSCAVNDDILTLRERIRRQSDDSILVDATLQIRERNRATSDSVASGDVLSGLAIRARQQTDSLDVAETIESLRERLRNITDDAALTDQIIVTLDTNVTLVTLTDQIDVSDAVDAQYIAPLGTFKIRHGIEQLAVDHGITYNLNIESGITQETS